MEFKEIAPGVKIPVLGLGTWGMGGFMTKSTAHDKEDIRAIKTALKLGMTHIDTAEMYGAGHAEELVGKAIKGFDRKKIFITSKVLPENLHYDDVIKAAKASLKRMKTDYVDLYLIHFPNPKIPIKETMQALDYLVKEKMTRFIGVSNFSLKEMLEAQSYTKNKIVANQVEYNLLVREPEKELLPYCQKHKILLTAYKPIAGGELAKPGFKCLDAMAEKYHKTQAQIALNWLISQKNVITIPKASNLKHLKENLGATGWHLSQKDMKELTEHFS